MNLIPNLLRQQERLARVLQHKQLVAKPLARKENCSSFLYDLHLAIHIQRKIGEIKPMEHREQDPSLDDFDCFCSTFFVLLCAILIAHESFVMSCEMAFNSRRTEPCWAREAEDLCQRLIRSWQIQRILMQTPAISFGTQKPLLAPAGQNASSRIMSISQAERSVKTLRIIGAVLKQSDRRLFPSD